MRRKLTWIWMLIFLPIMINAVNIIITKQMVLIFGIEVVFLCGAVIFALLPLVVIENMKWAYSDPNVKSR